MLTLNKSNPTVERDFAEVSRMTREIDRLLIGKAFANKKARNRL